MDFFAAIKSAADAFNNFMGWKTTSDKKKEEALKRDEDHKEQLRKELADARARGDERRVWQLESQLRDETIG